MPVPPIRPGGTGLQLQELVAQRGFAATVAQALSLPHRDSSVRPKGADYQWGKDPLEQLLVRFDSWRAVRSGNGSGWSLATKSTFGGRATLQAVTRVKLEQASKVT